jgi:hypothetical protein
VATAKVFTLDVGSAKALAPLHAFLSTIRADAIISTQSSQVGSRIFILILYENTHPQIIGTTPRDGDFSVPVGASVNILFDEALGDIGSVGASYITIYEAGVVLTPTSVSVVLDSSGARTNQLFLDFTITSNKVYQVVLKSSLPFRSGRTLGITRLLTFGS